MRCAAVHPKVPNRRAGLFGGKAGDVHTLIYHMALCFILFCRLLQARWKRSSELT